MRVEKIQPSRHKKGRILLFLEDGSLLKITEQELLDFGLRPGDQLDEEVLTRLRASAAGSDARAQAAAMIGRRAMSRRDLEQKLRDKGASAGDAAYAAEWLEAIGALNDADYAALLVRHYAGLGYGPARYREELRRHGIDRDLWEEAWRRPRTAGNWRSSISGTASGKKRRTNRNGSGRRRRWPAGASAGGM